MVNEILTVVLVGSIQLTAYRSLPSQTDCTPNHTSTGEKVTPDGIAISQEQLCGACKKLHKRCEHPEVEGHLHYGDWVHIPGVGIKRINDCMNVRHKMRMDIWVASKKEESDIWNRFKDRKVEVYKIVL